MIFCVWILPPLFVPWAFVIIVCENMCLSVLGTQLVLFLWYFLSSILSVSVKVLMLELFDIHFVSYVCFFHIFILIFLILISKRLNLIPFSLTSFKYFTFSVMQSWIQFLESSSYFFLDELSSLILPSKNILPFSGSNLCFFFL
jgi:hypothetical protein